MSSSSKHTPENTAGENTSGQKNLAVPIIAGSAGLLLCAAIVMQFVRAEPGVADTSGVGVASVSTNPYSGKSLGRVNGQSISYDQVAEECVKLHGEEVLESLINRLLIAQQCQKLGLTVTESEVLNEVKEISGKFNLDPSNWYQMLATERGLSREQYHRDIIWPMLALRKLAGEDVQVQEGDMKTTFQRDYGARVRARMILINGNMRQASEVWEKCEADPDNFDKLAREHSADSNTRSLGGMVPPIRMNGGNEAVEKEAFRLSPGEVSGVIHVDEGQYVILKCEGRTEPIVTDINEVWDDLYATLKEEKIQESVAITFDAIREAASVENYLTGEKTAGSPIKQASAINPTNRVQTAN